MAQYPSAIDLSSLDGASGVQITGQGAFNFAGASVASAGDVNGDGYGNGAADEAVALLGSTPAQMNPLDIV